MLLHHSAQRGLLGAMVSLVNRGAIRRPLALLADRRWPACEGPEVVSPNGLRPFAAPIARIAADLFAQRTGATFWWGPWCDLLTASGLRVHGSL